MGSHVSVDLEKYASSSTIKEEIEAHKICEKAEKNSEGAKKRYDEATKYYETVKKHYDEVGKMFVEAEKYMKDVETDYESGKRNKNFIDYYTNKICFEAVQKDYLEAEKELVGAIHIKGKAYNEMLVANYAQVEANYSYEKYKFHNGKSMYGYIVNNEK
jgi:hypothetical protein